MRCNTIWGGPTSRQSFWALITKPVIYHLAKFKQNRTTFCHRQYGSDFNQFDVASGSAEFGKITQNNGHYAVQGHSRSPFFGTNRNSVYDFMLVMVLTYTIIIIISLLKQLTNRSHKTQYNEIRKKIYKRKTKCISHAPFPSYCWLLSNFRCWQGWAFL